MAFEENDLDTIPDMSISDIAEAIGNLGLESNGFFEIHLIDKSTEITNDAIIPIEIGNCL